jgi:atypical dual specificity phosphatase
MLSVTPPPTRTSHHSNPRFGRTATLVLPRLYLSDLFTAQDAIQLSTLAITHVVSVIEHAPNLPHSIEPSHRLLVSIADRPDEDILKHLQDTTEFIRAALSENQGNNVLVHCQQGISRSATVVCAYVIATSTTNMIGQEAITFVQAKRAVISPNPGFRRQLDTYATRFIGLRPKGVDGSRRFRISEGIAERMRRLASGNPSDAQGGVAAP